MDEFEEYMRNGGIYTSNLDEQARLLRLPIGPSGNIASFPRSSSKILPATINKEPNYVRFQTRPITRSSDEISRYENGVGYRRFDRRPRLKSKR